MMARGLPHENKKYYAMEKFYPGFVIDDGICRVFAPQYRAARAITVQLLLCHRQRDDLLQPDQHVAPFSANILQHC
ncbi:hypothetical protein EHN07_12740 [Buttiauxella warmboldiae]|uniref:Uncharacterized protein n=1 Tax=Buttiauxella warmboldiae TaxID=82993 RepID=A0A3N5DVI3_9ENTR|nr:hypothetical protein [Buttiauxella warmboldiae]RPH25949.1 hypothetical protein EHN07_12740 [Buttiauxella warmboldiae]